MSLHHQPSDSSGSSAGQRDATEHTVANRIPSHFRPEPLPPDYLEAILRLAAQAPSGCDREPWRFIVVREEEARKRFQWSAADLARIGEAPVVVIAFALQESWKSGLESHLQSALRPGLDSPEEMALQRRALSEFLGDSPPALWVNRQILIALTTMILVAEAYGVRSAPLSGFDPEAIKQQFGLPSEADVVALLALGFPDDDDNAGGSRLQPALEEIVHVDRYGQPWHGEAN